MQMTYTYDDLQAKAHALSMKCAKEGELFRAVIMQTASSILANQEAGDRYGKTTLSLTVAILEWRKAIEGAKDSLIVELEDTNSDTLADETF
jgi:hypothetical protein